MARLLRKLKSDELLEFSTRPLKLLLDGTETYPVVADVDAEPCNCVGPPTNPASLWLLTGLLLLLLALLVVGVAALFGLIEPFGFTAVTGSCACAIGELPSATSSSASAIELSP